MIEPVHADFDPSQMSAAAQAARPCYPCRMTKPKPDNPATKAQTLSIPARLLLFCLASRTG
jgi:hypothetical protein